jgi:hypothetical protein
MPERDDPAGALAAGGAPALLDLTVRLGLAAYLSGLDDPQPALLMLLRDSEAAARDAGIGRLDWAERLAVLSRAWAAAEGPLPRLAAGLALSQGELFLLGLAVACERHRGVALAIACLQAPAAASRPSVHLALELAQALFPAAPADAWPGGRRAADAGRRGRAAAAPSGGAPAAVARAAARPRRLARRPRPCRHRFGRVAARVPGPGGAGAGIR